MFKGLHPSLRTFLIDRGLLFAFNLNMIFGASSIESYIYTREKLSKPNLDAIAAAFWWEDTFEGYEFWNAIETKWDIYLRFLESGGSVTIPKQ